MGWGGKGKGWGGDSWGKGWGKGSWAPAWQPMWGKGKGKGKSYPKSVPAERKVWIGGMAENSTSKDTNKELQKHMSQAGTCKFAEIGKSGTGVACFATAEEVANAVAMLNGSVFNGAVLQVDVWTKKEQ
eukprot:TRINITY_DN15251_c0_g1_i1.p1 TRINITY_DN15251_c0_g1~~TRINITY_DN15251_c0_g1_i1.p1  ORF type:complete len:129 (+),score=37.96 TRINITY_DN15251_c0_g1_i1:59-445(+)